MSTFRRLSKDKQEAILNGAAESFADKGYYGASIKEICTKANISNGALYKYFTNKEDLFLTIIYKCQEILEENLYRKYTHIEDTLIKTVEEYLEEIIIIHKRFPNYIKVYANLGSNNMEQFSKLHSPFTDSANYIYNMVKEAREKNEVSASIQDKELAFLLDNYFILFLNSLVSDYHEIRFRFFLQKKPDESLTNRDKIRFILNGVTSCLRDPN